MAACVLALAAPAAAEKGEHLLALRGEYARTVDVHGGGLGVAYAYGFTDLWNLYADFTWSRHLAGTALALDRMGGTVGVQIHLDAFQWVPYFVLGLGGEAAVTPGPTGSVTTGAFVGQALLGVDYRPIRKLGVGAFVSWTQRFVGDVPSHLAAGVRLVTYFQ